MKHRQEAPTARDVAILAISISIGLTVLYFVAAAFVHLAVKLGEGW